MHAAVRTPATTSCPLLNTVASPKHSLLTCLQQEAIGNMLCRSGMCPMRRQACGLCSLLRRLLKGAARSLQLERALAKGSAGVVEAPEVRP